MYQQTSTSNNSLANSAAKRLKLIVPVYNEEKNLDALYEKIKDVFSTLPAYDWELLFVNDGSQDNSWEVIVRLCENDHRVSGLCLSRNFSKELAMTAGLEATDDADAVIFIDADLQHPPSLIPKLVEKWRQGYDIVGTKRKKDSQSLTRKVCSFLFYKIQNSISEIPVDPHSTDFMLLDRIVIDALKKFTEHNRMVRGLVHWMGFKKTFVDFEAPSRYSGNNSYSYTRLIQLARNAITGFSLFPLRLAGYFGILLTTGFGLMLLIMIIDKLFFNFGGFTASAYVIVVNSIVVGIVLICLGVIALYIGNIHQDVSNRPLYIIRSKVNFREKSDTELKAVDNQQQEYSDITR